MTILRAYLAEAPSLQKACDAESVVLSTPGSFFWHRYGGVELVRVHIAFDSDEAREDFNMRNGFKEARALVVQRSEGICLKHEDFKCRRNSTPYAILIAA